MYTTRCPKCDLLNEDIHQSKYWACVQCGHKWNIIDERPKATKHDNGKLEFTLLIQDFAPQLEAMVKILTVGKDHHGRKNWQAELSDPEMFKDALHRHLNAYHQGYDDDEETKQPHLLHVAVNALIQVFHDQKKLQ